LISYSINLHVERIIISGTDVGPERAEEIRAQIGSELHNMLSQEGLPGGVLETRVSRISVPPPRLAEDKSTGALARGIARSVYGAIRGVK
jgi:hypothetical protein